MTVVLPAPVADLKQRYDALSEPDKQLLAEMIENERLEPASWPIEELERRIRRAEEAGVPGIPLELARSQTKAELARRREAARHQ